MVEFFFPTPIYSTEIKNPEFNKIQEEFKTIYNDLLDKDKFQYDRGRITQFLNKDPFNGNILKEYDTPVFTKQLHYHIKRYVCEINDIKEKREEVIELNWPYKYEIKSSWMTLNKKGMYALAHNHAYADISGCYYYKTNSRDGNIMFHNPNTLLNTSLLFRHIDNALQFTPEEGNLILFPGWIQHSVLTNNTDDDRVSISFNVYFER